MSGSVVRTQRKIREARKLLVAAQGEAVAELRDELGPVIERLKLAEDRSAQLLRDGFTRSKGT